MRKAMAVLVMTVVSAGLWVEGAHACGKTRRRPNPPMCQPGVVGSVTSAAGSQATVRFSGEDGLPLASSRGMTLASTEGCACVVAVRKSPGVSVTGVTFPASYPGFVQEQGTARAQNAAAFAEHYLVLDGQNPDDYEIVVFITTTGVTIPAGVDFDLDVDYAIPSGSSGDEIAQALGVLGFLGYDGDQVFAEPSEGEVHVSLAEYTAPGFDLTAAAVFYTETVMPPAPATGGEADAVLGPELRNPRNFDARAEAKRTGMAQRLVERPKLEALRARFPALRTSVHEYTGAVRTLNRPIGFLTAGDATGRPARDIALDFVRRQAGALGLDQEDLEDRELTDEVLSDVTGVTHLYWRQLLDGIPVYNGQLHVNVDRHGRVQSVNNAFVPNLSRAANSLRPQLSGEEAVAAALESIGVDAQPTALATGGDARQTTQIDPAGFSLSPVTAQLMLLPINQGKARLVWNFVIETVDENHLFDFNVDAVSGKVWTRFDLVSDAVYRVYPQPVESPNHTSPAPPADARVLVTDPQAAAPTASPNGWHSTGTSSFTILRGNNVHAYEDRDANNSPPASQPSSGSLSFDFAINLGQQPSSYISAAVTNLFYWNNLIHDVQYQHGFTESAGNFQVNNFGKGGAGNDDVRAEAQDGSGTCNANFATPTDGGRPRMQMFVCGDVCSSRDGDLDNGVIVHEYGHGISIRQVGGPSNSSCLNNVQQPGEGWSDWFGLVYTAKPGDTGPQGRGIGSYLFGLAPDGTIRPQRYSTDPAINTYTYEAIAGQPIPHGLGSVWAQALWEVYWALVVTHGFDPNLYNPGSASGAAGNIRALTYVNEGLKNIACSPTFLDARDGILQAATNLHGGEDVCDIWEAFAAFGLGTDASTGGSSSTTATNGFNVPAACDGEPPPPPPPG